jgi:hypothetical protein
MLGLFRAGQKDYYLSEAVLLYMEKLQLPELLFT